MEREGYFFDTFSSSFSIFGRRVNNFVTKICFSDSLMIDKPHYYDGKFYEMFIDLFFKEIRNSMSDQIESGSRVIDIGCGTGSFVFVLAEKCASVTGVELSSKMLAHAMSRQRLHGKHNVCFIHADATNLSDFKDKQFDYVTISMALHEMPHDVRERALLEAKRIGKKIIIADYAAPQPLTFAGVRIRIVEFLAGIEHFKAFLDFQKNRGIDQLLNNSGLFVFHESIIKDGTIRIVVAQ